MDCANVHLGCSGGWIDRIIGWVASNGGVNSASTYPRLGVRSTCRASSRNVASIRTYESVARGNEADLLAKAAKGPLAVGIAASNRGFQLYQSGVYTDSTCTAAGINHAVTLVGWGTENGAPYWLLKNQWGTGWGAQGYIKMRRGTNQCGIASMAYRPIV